MKNAGAATPLTISETQEMAKNMVKMLLERATEGKFVGATVLALHGDLGAGKTTFMQFLGEALGVREKMQSPTFVIEKIYKIEEEKIKEKFDHLVHIDAYRIENPQEMLTLGWKTIVANPRNIIAVEWSERLGSLIPPDALRIQFMHHDETHRIIAIE